jgi:twitching motility protein PilI
MAKKQALRDLQHRLAERMRQAQAERRGVSWLAVDCAGHGLLFPLQQAGEIFDAVAVLPVPHTQPWFAGVANLRGGLHCVVDLAAFLGLRPPHSAGEPARDGARLVVLNPGLGLNCALLVDRLSGLRQPGEMTADGAEVPNRPAFASARWRDASGQIWQEIELAELAGDRQFLAVAG